MAMVALSWKIGIFMSIATYRKILVNFMCSLNTSFPNGISVGETRKCVEGVTSPSLFILSSCVSYFAHLCQNACHLYNSG